MTVSVIRIGSWSERARENRDAFPSREGALSRGELDERSVWAAAFGWEWVRGLDQFAGRAAEAGLSIEAGSGELLRTRFAGRFGWGPSSAVRLSLGARASSSAKEELATLRGAWVLRTLPGRSSDVRLLFEEFSELEPVGPRPFFHTEESALAHLPRLEREEAWPSAEAWLRSALLVEERRSLRSITPPRNWEDLMSQLLRAPSGAGPDADRSLDRAEAELRAFDRLRAAIAWERDPGAYARSREERASRRSVNKERRK